jgi:hypothetical protein
VATLPYLPLSTLYYPQILGQNCSDLLATSREREQEISERRK